MENKHHHQTINNFISFARYGEICFFLYAKAAVSAVYLLRSFQLVFHFTFETINCYRHHKNNVVSVTYIGSVLFMMIHRSIHAKESEFKLCLAALEELVVNACFNLKWTDPALTTSNLGCRRPTNQTTPVSGQISISFPLSAVLRPEGI